VTIDRDGGGPEREILPSGGYQYGKSNPALQPAVPGRPKPATRVPSAVFRPAARPSPATAAAQAPAGPPLVPIGRVHPHPRNPRHDLGDLSETAASIRAHGILQPLVVRQHPRLAGQWEVIAGHRRLAAARAAGLAMVPVIVREAPGALPEELMLIENLHREDLNPMDKAEAHGRLREGGRSVAGISASTGLHEKTIYASLLLLELAPMTRQAVREGRLSAADALEAIRRERKRRRRSAGKPAMGGGEWEPDWFTSRHPLAGKASALCDDMGHTMRRRLGKVACGECFEAVIRVDERNATAAPGGQP
jgi:ParB family transcriptional regulator, chromosome partitioning protein